MKNITFHPRMRRRVIAETMALISSAGTAAAADFQIIVNTANPVQAVTKEQVARSFMRKIKKWDNGSSVVPVDQTANLPVRDAFSKAIHGRATRAIVAAWQQEIFAGREIPPAEKSGDAAVIAFVKANPGAIGYVASFSPTEGVRVVDVR